MTHGHDSERLSLPRAGSSPLSAFTKYVARFHMQRPSGGPEDHLHAEPRIMTSRFSFPNLTQFPGLPPSARTGYPAVLEQETHDLLVAQPFVRF